MGNVFCFESLDSTNSKAISMAREGLKEGVIVASRQTGGRGRMGRSFVSPQGGLYLSYLTDRLKGGDAVLGITPAAALAVRSAILRTFGLACRIKYPNDLILQERKVCGILCESLALGERFCVVIGVGVNVQTDIILAECEQTSDYPPGALRSFCEKAKDPASIGELRQNLTGELDALVEHFSSGGLLNEAEYRNYCIHCPDVIIQY